MPEVRRPVAFLILGVLCAQFLVLGLVQASRDAVTIDEAVDLAAGLVAVEHRDLRMNPEHAWFIHVAPAVLPVLVADPIVPRTDAYRDGDWFDYTDDLVSANDRAGRLDDVVFWFRVVPLVLGAGTGVALYVLGTRLVSRAGGLVAGALWLTTPYVVGLAHLSSLDTTFAFWVIVLALTLDRLRGSPSEGRTFEVAAALALCLATRHSAIVLVPVVLVAVLLAGGTSTARARLVRLGIVLVVPIVGLWLCYRGVDPGGVAGAQRERFDGLIATASAENPLHAAALAVPFPMEWRAGLAYLIETSEPRPAFLLGREWTGQQWWYFPVSTLLKVPIGALATVLVGAWAIGRSRDRARALPSALLAGALALFLVAQPLALGLRLAVPVLVLAFVLSAGVARLRRRIGVMLVVVAVVGQLVATALAHPTSLAWNTPPFYDSYRSVSDGNLDIGQANETIRRRFDARSVVAASLSGPRGFVVLPGVPRVEEVDARALVGDVLVSGTELTVRHRDELRWLRAYCPVEVVDSAVLRYRFTKPPDLTPGPSTPASPCDGGVSVRE